LQYSQLTHILCIAKGVVKNPYLLFIGKCHETTIHKTNVHKTRASDPNFYLLFRSHG
jgi:hypothetical protein